MSEIVRYEQADGVAVITLNRPDAMNSFTSQLSFDLLSVGYDKITITGVDDCKNGGDTFTVTITAASSVEVISHKWIGSSLNFFSDANELRSPNPVRSGQAFVNCA